MANRQRAPRTHWILLAFGGLILAGMLVFDGFVHGVVGGSSREEVLEAPESVKSGGPVIQTDGTRTRSLRLPAGTIALTFDGGPDARWTPAILDVLKRHQVGGTFFAVGRDVARHPEIVRRMLAEGHEVGNYTYTHADLDTSGDARIRFELSLTQRALAGAAGVKTRLMRMPYSATPQRLTGEEWQAVRTSSAAGYLVVLTDRDTENLNERSVAAMVKAATTARKRGEGAIIALSDSEGALTIAAVEQIITELKSQRYRFTTVTGGLGLPRAEAAASNTEQSIGEVLVFSQQFSGQLIGILPVVFGVAGVLGLLRQFSLVVFARLHVRRVRSRKRARPEDLLAPTVSVIVPAYNEEAGIAASIRSLVDTDYSGRMEILVVDDGSTDRTAEIVASLRLPGVRLIRKDNGGKPSALNAGIAQARGEIMVMVDGDTVFQRDTIRKLVQGFADPRVGAVSGNTKVANRGGLLGRWQHLEYVIGFNLDRRMYDLLQCMPTVPGAISAFRREILIQIGGVSDDTLAEDTDLSMTVGRSGWRVVYEESAIAWTEAPATLRQLWRQRYRWCYGTMQAMWKHRGSMRERFGRRCLTYLLVFQVILPLIAPVVDIVALYGLLVLDPVYAFATWLPFIIGPMIAGAYALRLDHEPVGPLWALPLQQFVYRQLMYLVVIQALITAVLGARLHWQPLRRTGTFTDAPVPAEMLSPR
jgi:cellulose synthase/poly-beta-1,6-N-acetylglucosamine synthase-like glycosyltransferase/peptidoglycan/xylan/chitin deacetylase (PgdA/CDA1 family)